ncbi:histidine kinase [Pseudomonas monteilii]|uniref:histidine kinase n=1 Tax=Pseudomonas monteilii TaxID=76759 RepID=UPI0018AB5706|nr:histidine kinase [Pseudomonas monteilii]MBF8747386.1 histidine kinase [Pseudomonas monteilii]
MPRPYVLLHQARPSHQILLHQACNALGIFDVRVTRDLADLQACLARERVADLLILDAGLAPATAQVLFERLTDSHQVPALLFVGSRGDDERESPAGQARTRGFKVLAELSWPLPMRRWQQALERIQTVMSSQHAH